MEMLVLEKFWQKKYRLASGRSEKSKTVDQVSHLQYILSQISTKENCNLI